MKMQDELLNAIVMVNDGLLNWQGQFDPDRLVQVLDRFDHYNDFDPSLVKKGISRINKAVPPMKFGEGNPNNGKPHHNFRIGRECSMVIYLDIITSYMPSDFDYTALEKELIKIGKFMKASERDLVKNNGGNFVFRFWWD